MDVQFHLRSASDLGVPTNTSGSTRPLMMMNRPIHTAHYTGLRPDQIWFSGGDGVFDSIEAVFQFVKRLEEVARRAGKPFEYNTVIPVMADGSAHVLAYADEYVAAHSSGENTLAHGTLFITGIGQELNDGAILAFQWWNAVLESSGRLTSNSQILPHNQMSGAATDCPGPPIIRRLPELRTPYSPPAPSAPPASTYKRIAMAQSLEFASAGRWDTRGFGKPIPAGEYTVKLDGSEGKVGVMCNVAIVSAVGPGYATAWLGGPRPDTSKVNYQANQAVANEVCVPLAGDGTFKIFISSAAHIIIDLTGYFLA